MAHHAVISLFVLMAVVTYCQGQPGLNPIRQASQVGSGLAKPLIPSGHSPVAPPQAAKSASYPYYPTYPYRPAPYPYPAPVPYPIYPFPAPTPAPPAPVVPDTGMKVTCDICNKVDTGFKAILDRFDEIEKKIEGGGGDSVSAQGIAKRQ